MTYSEALQYIHSKTWLGSKPGLSRTRTLLGKMGNPQEKLSFIHVAGTNGKGSFCAMLASVLLAAGYKVGLYTSPYILTFTERIRINGKNIPEEDLAEITAFVRPFAEEMTDRPTEFELITAMAMEYFARKKCDIVVLECGMGGRLDSTNVIRTPLLSVITGVSFDHTAFLGNTIEKIAAEKAGIIKPKVPCLFCGEDSLALAVIKKKAEQLGAPFFTVKKKNLAIKQTNLTGTRFDTKEYTDLFIPLLGLYQPQNALNVLTAIDLLRGKGMRIPEKAVREGFACVKWRARYEKIANNPLILFDGGHNPEGIKAAVESTKAYFAEEKLILVTGVMSDKNHKDMAEELSSIAKAVFCAKPSNPRALAQEEWRKEFAARGIPAYACSSVANALLNAINEAKKQKTAVLCIGSLYMYREIMDALEEHTGTCQ